MTPLSLSDEEIIRRFMGWGQDVILNLDNLWQVQNNLTEKQWEKYRGFICRTWQSRKVLPCLSTFYLNLTAQQKIEALAAVLRSMVEANKNDD